MTRRSANAFLHGLAAALFALSLAAGLAAVLFVTGAVEDHGQGGIGGVGRCLTVAGCGAPAGPQLRPERDG